MLQLYDSVHKQELCQVVPTGLRLNAAQLPARSEREVCLPSWQTENGSFVMVAARSTRAPSTAVVVVKCSMLEWHFQVQIVCECCSGQSSSVQDTSAGCWWTNAGCCSQQACVFPSVGQTFIPLRHPATCVPLYDPVFPLLTRPCLWSPPLPSPHYCSGWWLVQAGELYKFPWFVKTHIIDQCRFRPLWLMWEILYFCINVYWL